MFFFFLIWKLGKICIFFVGVYIYDVYKKTCGLRERLYFLFAKKLFSYFFYPRKRVIREIGKRLFCNSKEILFFCTFWFKKSFEKKESFIKDTQEKKMDEEKKKFSWKTYWIFLEKEGKIRACFWDAKNSVFICCFSSEVISWTPPLLTECRGWPD